MKVSQFLAILSEADPEAQVLVFPPHADPSDGGPPQDVIVEDKFWTHESGLYEGRPYESYYPDQAEPMEHLYTDVAIRRVRVVLVGEELGNFRLQRN
ncbi:hypothetical protein P0D69_21800 [Paraburkholderia sediminicola]|uniref:hypothetical protein n=1 Tax=Paraburkholderia sediminicola TaxID=458836 RepID=UPI0038B71D1A